MLIIIRKKTTLSYVIYRIYFSQEHLRSVSRSAKIIPRAIGNYPCFFEVLFRRDRLTLRVLAFRKARFKSMHTDLGHPRFYDPKRSFSISFPFSFFVAKKLLYWCSMGPDFFPEGRGREGICFRSWQELWISRLVSRVLI